jgi:type II secretory pathway pseudopilin PulG
MTRNQDSKRAGRHSNRSNGFTLIEVLVYMGLLFMVLGMAYLAMYRSMDASTALRRNANDIVEALKAGEQWRDDVRSATGPIRSDRTSQQVTLHLPQGQTEIEYAFSTNTVSRRVGSDEWSVVLANVKNSAFIDDRREKVTAWRWEIELQPGKKRITRVQPLFTFIAVPPGNFAP